MIEEADDEKVEREAVRELAGVWQAEDGGETCPERMNTSLSSVITAPGRTAAGGDAV